MAYDKLVDSAKLDGALKRTADAIRGKTGGTENIPWSETEGFKSAVEGITAGMDESELDEILDTVNDLNGSETVYVVKGVGPTNISEASGVVKTVARGIAAGSNQVVTNTASATGIVVA